MYGYSVRYTTDQSISMRPVNI
uniref:Uncharacterized protein n=1 Tax=Tetranychus urticae TaxID=32264 RepID=T1KRS5_TETUR